MKYLMLNVIVLYLQCHSADLVGLMNVYNHVKHKNKNDS